MGLTSCEIRVWPNDTSASYVSLDHLQNANSIVNISKGIKSLRSRATVSLFHKGPVKKICLCHLAFSFFSLLMDPFSNLVLTLHILID